MSTAARWQVAGGSVRGTRHRHGDRNNQDGMCWIDADGVLVLVVTDGCSSAPHAEAGALLGSAIVARRTHRLACGLGLRDAQAVACATRNALADDIAAVDAMTGAGGRGIMEYLLFTAVVAVIDHEHAVVFVLGDGVATLNAQTQVVSSPSNRPDYPAYAALDPAAAVEPRILWHCAAADVNSVLVGTDGVADIIGHCSAPMPGRSDRLGPLSQFWTDARMFANPDHLRRRLTLANREIRRIDWGTRTVTSTPGLLPDDTTLVVARRAPES